VPLGAPAVVTAPPPANNDRKPAPRPTAGKKSAIITTASRKRLKLLRAERASDDGREVSPEVKAFLARMIRPGGSLPPKELGSGRDVSDVRSAATLGMLIDISVPPVDVKCRATALRLLVRRGEMAGILTRLSKYATILPGMSFLAQRETWWREMMMRSAEKPLAPGEPVKTESEQKKPEVPIWPEDDRLPKTPWR